MNCSWNVTKEDGGLIVYEFLCFFVVVLITPSVEEVTSAFISTVSSVFFSPRDVTLMIPSHESVISACILYRFE